MASQVSAPSAIAATQLGAAVTSAVASTEDKITCFIDGKLRQDKPEERVRQSIAKRLVNSLKYPKSRIRVEYGVKLGSNKPRVDLAIFKDGTATLQENIEIIVECKKETISASDKSDGVDQLKSYMAACANCTWGLWTNGKQREVWRKLVDQKGTISFVEDIDIPSASGQVAGSTRKRSDLDRAVGDVLLYAFKTSHNHIYVIDGFQKEKAFFELLKVIFCKIFDEKNSPHPLEFFVSPTELTTADGQLAAKTRIDKIFSRVKSKYPQIFESGESIQLQPRSLARVVAELQNFSLLSTDIDLKGKAYEEIVGSNLKGDRGQFFTPRNVMHMAIDMVNPSMSERIIDPACGTAGFLVIAMLYVIEGLRKDFEKDIGKAASSWSHGEQKSFDDKVNEVAASNFFGFDITPELVKAAKMNMVMNNDGSGNILQADSLLPPYRWSQSFRAELAKALNKSEPDSSKHITDKQLNAAKDLARFDIVVTNPPFGSKIVIKDHEVLEQFDLGHIWERPKKAGDPWAKTSRLQGGVPPEQLFVERCVQLLKPGGRMAIVVPDSILGSPGLAYIRQWLLGETRIIASIDLHQDAFQPHTGVQTSILIVQKKTEAEKQAAAGDYDIFMAMVERVGHDKRGNTVYKRDPAGHEILEKVVETVPDESGGTKQESRLEKVIDDQTSLVAPIFQNWKSKEGLPW